MSTRKGIPVYKASIEDTDGMLKISLVDLPAVMTDFQTFDETKPVQKFEVADEEKRLIFGVVMRADFPIYREDEKRGEYYLVFDKDCIREMAEKYLADGNCNKINLQHEDGSDVDGVQMVQYFIKDSGRGMNPEGFEDIEDGSLFAEFHCTNDEVWDGVKSGEFKGFSLEGIFQQIPVQAQAVEPEAGMLAEAVAALEEHPNKNKVMSLITRLRAALAESIAVQKFGRVATDKGTIIWEGEDELAADMAVWSEDADGNRIELEDGDYKTDDSKVITIAGGKVSEIKDAEPEPEPTAEEQMRTQLREKFARIREAFSYSMESLYGQIYALFPDTDDVWHNVLELGNDYFILDVYDYAANTEKYFKYSYTADEQGNITLGEGVEVKHDWTPVGEPAGAQGGEGESEAMKAENATLKARVAELEAKLAEPAGQSAHEAFSKQSGSPENPFDLMRRYAR